MPVSFELRRVEACGAVGVCGLWASEREKKRTEAAAWNQRSTYK